MTVATKELTVTEKNEALFAPKAEAIRVGDDDCFAPVSPRKPVKRILALGTALASQPIVIKTVADELDAMAADLATLQAGLVEPIIVMSAETLDAIESEAIGETFSTQPFLY